MSRGARGMNATRIITVMGFVVCLAATCLRPVAFAQQAPSVTSIEQEFFDAIKKGNSQRVSELLKQQPALMKASTKNGTTPVLVAVYAHHPEIAETLLAAGIEPNIFESAAMGRVERVRALLKKNPELVKAYSPDGWTALHLN